MVNETSIVCAAYAAAIRGGDSESTFALLEAVTRRLIRPVIKTCISHIAALTLEGGSERNDVDVERLSKTIATAWRLMLSRRLIVPTAFLEALSQQRVAHLFFSTWIRFHVSSVMASSLLLPIGDEAIEAALIPSIIDGDQQQSEDEQNEDPNTDAIEGESPSASSLPLDDTRLCAFEQLADISTERLLPEFVVAMSLKIDGNQRFGEGKLVEAATKYQEGVAALTAHGPLYCTEVRELASILMSNKAQCHIRREEWSLARRAALGALKFDEQNEKAKQRLALAEENLSASLQRIERTARTEALKKECQQQ